MTPAVRRIGIAATPAPWSKSFRNYARDHAAGVEVETLLDPRQLHRPGRAPFHILLVDDTARTFSSSAVAEAVGDGTFVVGLFDQTNGMGRGYLERLGVQLILPSATGPEELIRTVLRLAPVPEAAEPTGPGEPKGQAPGPPTDRRQRGGGAVSVWYSVTGGCGLTETVIGVAESLAAERRVLVVEADPLASSMAARLSRSPAVGLSWALGRVSHGQLALPDGLAGIRDDGVRPLGRFDLVAQTSLPGGPPLTDPDSLLGLISEARESYDHVLVGTGPLVTAPASSGKDRFAGGRALLGVADVAVAVATADPLGAVELGGWKAAAAELAKSGPFWAVLGRGGRARFEEAQLAELIGTATALRPFQRLWFLPEDEAVRLARWNSHLVARGRWHACIRRLAAGLGAVVATSHAEAPARSEGWGLVVSQ
ncbi:MAG: P-loop NTPase family protein [Acidimicrobiales bacterium]